MFVGRPQNWSIEPHLTSPAFRDIWSSAVLAVIPQSGEPANWHRNLITGLAPTVQNGNPTTALRPWLGQSWIGDGTGDQFDFPLGYAAVGNTTLAAIAIKTTTARSSNIISTSSGTNAGVRMYVNASNQLGLTLGGVASYDFTTAGAALTIGDPYFLAASYNKQNGFVIFLHRNLKTGNIQSGGFSASGTPVAGDGRYAIGGLAVGASTCWDGAVAMGMVCHEYLGYAQLFQWAKDPWGPFRFFDEAKVVVAKATGPATYTYSGSGTITFSGAADVAKEKAYSASGTITLSGAATTSYTSAGATTYTYSGTGTVTLSGAAAIARTKASESSGAITFFGAATTNYTPGLVTYSYAGSGEIVFSGLADTSGPIVRRDTGAGRSRRTPRRRYIIEDRLYELTTEELAFALEKLGKEPEEAQHVKRLSNTTERKVQAAKARSMDRARPLAYIPVASILPDLMPRLEPLDTDTLIAVYEAMQEQQRGQRMAAIRAEEEVILMALVTA